MDLGAFIVTVTGFSLPVKSPLQPVNMYPAFGDALK
jgi:hypothetical protein